MGSTEDVLEPLDQHLLDCICPRQCPGKDPSRTHRPRLAADRSQALLWAQSMKVVPLQIQFTGEEMKNQEG